MNFYSTKDSLMAHQDKSELNEDAPLISFSLGNACIFLMGGSSLEEEPVPLMLHSGDVVIMHGSGRKAFHGNFLRIHVRCASNS